MFYEPDKRDHGLPRDPFKSLVVPRPIGWISTLDAEGRPNLAPYSFCNAVASDPPVVVFGTSRRPDGSRKDSQRNIEATGEFVLNLAIHELRAEMNTTSATLSPGESEFAAAGLDTLPARLVRPPRVRASPVHFECVWLQTVALPCNTPGQGNFAVFGRVVGVHVDDALIADGLVDIARARPIARLGYMDYTSVDRVFSMDRPG